jgi:hypothetical protein
LFQHLLDAFLDRQQLPGVGLLGQVEGTTGAGQAVRAFGEEVVGAVAVAQVVVLPGLSVGGGAGQDALAVDEDLDGADVVGEVVGLLVGVLGPFPQD